MPRADSYFSLDIEADGPVPGLYSMLSVGVVHAGRDDGAGFRPATLQTTFYRELQPLGEHVDPEALAVSGLDRERLQTEGADPAIAMRDLADWVVATSLGDKPVVVAWPVAFDCAFLAYTFVATGVTSPFGVSDTLDLRTAYATRTSRVLGQVHLDRLPEGVRPIRPHTHHALDDALSQAEILGHVMRLAPELTGCLAVPRTRP